MQLIKKLFGYISIFCFSVIILTGLLVASAKIPQSAIKENVKESAEYLCEGELFGKAVECAESSKIDRYADSILLAIAWQYDSSSSLRSVMLSSYYYREHQNENENLLDAVTDGYEPNQQYMRYWHGSIAVLRPLLVIFNIKQIYILNGVVMVLLILWLEAVLFKNRMYGPAIGVAAGLIMTSFWFVPLSLEYTWTYLFMLFMSVIGVKLALREKWNVMGAYFLIGGMVTNYLDFLTTETLTLTVPLLLISWVKLHKRMNAAEVTKKTESINIWKHAGKSVLLWGAGYTGMWVMKWIMATVVLNENVMPYISEHIGERLSGDIGLSWWDYISGAVWRNVRCLFPFEYGIVGMIAGIILVVASIYAGYVYHGKNICKEKVALYALTGLVPYIRYIVLHNHSYLHFFFTYRAQLATILAIVLILEEMTDWRWLLHGNGRKRKP
ncbi:MAG: hypothetical protein ACI4E1_06265 [Lachnospira sp.]